MRDKAPQKPSRACSHFYLLFYHKTILPQKLKTADMLSFSANNSAQTISGNLIIQSGWVSFNQTGTTITASTSGIFGGAHHGISWIAVGTT